MELSNEIIEKLVPQEPPPETPNTIGAFLLAQQIEDPVLRRSYLWAQAILSNLYNFPILNDRLSLLPLRTSHGSAGFVYINPELMAYQYPPFDYERSISFGAYVLVNSDERPQEISSIIIGGLRIPIVINYGRFQPHGCPPHPPGGTGCCWVENKGQNSWSKGLLASRHVVGSYSIGNTINLSSSNTHAIPLSGMLADIDACTIDAAVVSIDPLDWPSGLNSLSVPGIIAPGMRGVRFDGKYTSTSGSVLRVYQDPHYFGNLFGHRVITDCYGSPGDSGTLLMDNKYNGLGIYMGTIPDGNGGHEGMFQDLKQVKQFFELDLFY